VVFVSQTNAMEAGLSNTVLGTNTVSVSGFVYTGQSTWTATGGSWTNFANWNALGGTPGLDGMLSTNDSATFGPLGSGTVSLGTNAALNALNFSNAVSGYVIAGAGTISLVQGSNAPVIGSQAGSNAIYSDLNLATNVTVNVASESQITLAGTLEGPGGIAKGGSGTLLLTGACNYSGESTVNGGALLVNGTIRNSAVTAESGGILGGNGSIGGAVTIASGGSLSPGSDGVGALTFTGDLTLQAGSETTFLINDTNNFTSINLMGSNVNYGGALSFNITSYSPTPGDIFTLFNMIAASTEHGDFSSVTAGGLIFAGAEGTWTGTTNGYTYQFMESTGQLSVAEAVPEPSTYVLLGIGALVLTMVFRRRDA
jgi:autotransporter-associated beta strand protein